MSKTVLFQIIQFSISTQFKYKYGLIVKNISISSYSVYSNNSEFYLTHRKGPIRCYHARAGWTWEQWQWSGAPYSQKPQRYWDLTIRQLSVISRTLVRSVLSSKKVIIMSGRFFESVDKDGEHMETVYNYIINVFPEVCLHVFIIHVYLMVEAPLKPLAWFMVKLSYSFQCPLRHHSPVGWGCRTHFLSLE